MIIKDAFGKTAEVHLYDKDTGLNAQWYFKEL